MFNGPALAFLGGSVGTGELLVVFLVVLVLFGPRRLPEIARNVGRFLAELRRASQDFRDQVMRIDETPPHPPKPASPSDAKPGGVLSPPAEGNGHGLG